jgi:hypothetical protein
MTEAEWEACTDPRKMLECLREVGRVHALRTQPILRDTGRVGERQARLFAAACCRQLWPVLTDERSRAAVKGAECCGEDLAAARDMDALHRAAGEVDYVDYPEAHDDDIIAEAQAWLDSGAGRSDAAGWRAILAGQYAAHAAFCAAAVAGSACKAWRGEFKDLSELGWLSSMAWVCADKTAQSASVAATVWSEKVDAALVAGWLVGQGGAVGAAFDAACRPAKAVQANLLHDIAGSPFRPPPFIAPAVLASKGGATRRLAEAIYAERAFDRMPILADALEEAGCTDANLLGHLREPGPHTPGCWALDLILARE